MPTSDARRLAAEIASLRKAVADLQRSSRLSHSSIEGSLEANDDDGEVILTIGEQPDGTYGVQPRAGGVVKANDLADDTVGTDHIKDFAIPVTKFRSTRHYLY